MNSIKVDDITLIPLTKGYVAVIDTADAPLVLAYKWCAVRPRGETAYATTRVNGAPTSLHRLLMQSPPCDVDHINGDGIDCRRANMRLATRSQNIVNKPPSGALGIKGVHNYKGSGRYTAKICVGGKQKHLGSFPDSISAGRAYDRAAFDAYGEYAWLNFPDEVAS